MSSEIDELKNSCFAKDLTQDELKTLNEIAKSKVYYKNEKIFDEDDESNSLYLLVEGRVCIERKAFPTRHLFIPQIQIVKHGQIFGEMAFLEDAPRSATARAKGNVRVLVFQNSTLKNLMTENTALGYKLMANIAKIVSRRLRRMNDQWLSAVGNDFVMPEFEYLD